MWSHAFTEPTFKKGLNKYLTAKKFSYAKEDDLFDAVAEAVTEDKNLAEGLKVFDIMESWTRRPGFPVLHVTRDYAGGVIVLTQQRYYNNHSLEDPMADKLWQIPFNFITSNNESISNEDTKAEHWLTVKSMNVTQTDQVKWTPENWILFNKQATGYYRVIYDQANYKLLSESLKKNEASQIDSKSRSQLIDDAFNFARYGRIPFNISLDLLEFLKNDTSYLPWFAGNKVLSFLDGRLAGNERHEWFKVCIYKCRRKLVAEKRQK